MSGFNADGTPKGEMRQPDVPPGRFFDKPNDPRHDELRKTWRAGQRWETLIDGCEIWCPVGDGGYAEPTWDGNQSYRQTAEE